MKRARKIRNTKLKELEEHVKKCGETDVMIAGHFNENARSANLQNIMNETCLFDLFQEINRVKPEEREATHDHRNKCIDCVLATEDLLCNMKGIEAIEYSEIIESHHRGNLTDVNF